MIPSPLPRKNLISVSMMISRLFSFIGLSFFATLALAAPDAQLKPAPSATLQQLLRHHGLSAEDVSFQVVELENQKSVEEFSASRPEVPASLMKVPACLYALSVLGGHHRFPTQLLARGKIHQGILKGDLILKGHGDPYLTSPRLLDLSLKLVHSGIKRVEGKFYYDDSALPEIPQISKMGLGDQTYNPGLSALNFEFNRVRIQKSPSEASSFHAEFKTIPFLNYFKIEKIKTPFAPKQQFNWSGPEDKNETWQVSTKNSYRHLETIPIRKPSLYTAQMFRLYSKRLGLELSDPSSFPMSPQAANLQVVAETLSSPVLKLCAMALEYSNNLFAESLMLATALSQKDEITNLEQAAEKMQNWFQENYPDIDWEGSVFKNGSGLSLKSRISAKALTQLLVHENKRQDLNRSFWSLLSISGQTGWLKNRFTEDEVSHRIFAKTGSLDFVHNIAGYFISKKNKSYAFSLMVSDIEKRQKAESLKTDSSASLLLYRQASSYRFKARNFSDELLTHWIQKL